MGRVEVREVQGRRGIREFVAAQAPLYAHDPNYAAPPDFYLARRLDPTREPFWAHAERGLFVARRGRRAVGRVAAIANHLHNGTWHDRVAFFGLFECEDDCETAAALLDLAAAWARDRGYDALRGPVNFSVHDEIGLLVHGFDRPPRVMMPYNAPYHGALLEAAGCRRLKDLVAYDWTYTEMPAPPAALERRAARGWTAGRAILRQFDRGRLAEETVRFRAVYNAAFAGSWGFVPITAEEALAMVADFARFGDPRLCWLAEVDGEPAGFLLMLPDVNQGFHALRRGFPALRPFRAAAALWAPRAVRVVTLAIDPRFRRLNLAGHLVVKAWRQAVGQGIRVAEFSYVDEDNANMNGMLRRMGCHVSKRYRIYERPLASTSTASAAAGTVR
ncbi:MAG: GNAT family N-acetyltransferase [Deltaproteobacteria bacterium]|nr:GNAT family N-acetyltransferase [Deltaproteobacteria bacterium]